MIGLRDVLEGTKGVLRGSAAPDLLFRRVWHDSRSVEPGDLFVALRGERHDGHDFIPDAVRRVPPLCLSRRGGRMSLHLSVCR